MAKKKKSSFRDKVVENTKKQKSEASSYGYLNLPQGIKIFKEDPGRIRLDIIPYEVSDKKHPDRNDEFEIATPGELWYRRPFKTHRNVGASNDTLICPTTFGKKCPICEYRQQRIGEGAEYEETKLLKPAQRNLYAVIPKDHKEYDEVVHIWDISQFLFQNLLNDELEENEDYAVFPDLEDGYTLYIRFDEKKLGKNKFAETSRIDFEERDEGYDEDIIKVDLDNVLKVLGYEDLKTRFFEIDDEDVSDEKVKEDDDEPEPVVTKRKKKKAIDPEPEEEDHPDGDDEKTYAEDDNDEDEEKPAKKREKKEKKSNKNKCPHGHEFGADCDEYPDDCDDCDSWDDCSDEQEKLKDN